MCDLLADAIYRRYELAHILALAEAEVCVTLAERNGDRLAQTCYAGALAG